MRGDSRKRRCSEFTADKVAVQAVARCDEALEARVSVEHVCDEIRNEARADCTNAAEPRAPRRKKLGPAVNDTSSSVRLALNQPSSRRAGSAS
eukprot:a346467_3.p2 GENE.a346467_3~~a346467_3.p2  ORF type:complete len:102 (+),score=20.88 a346467_3:28-306(+)